MDPFVASCASCGGPFLARRRAARYCGAACRQRARRARGQGLVAPLPGRQAEPAPLTYAERFVESVRGKFAEVGLLDDPVALLALSLAEESMRTDLAASVRCGLTTMFRRTYVDVIRGVRAPTTIDELRARRRGTR